MCKTWNRFCRQLLEDACFTTLNASGKRTKMSTTSISSVPGGSREPREFRIVVIGSGEDGPLLIQKVPVESPVLCVASSRETMWRSELELISQLSRYDPTIEDSYRKAIEIDGVPCVLDIMDTGGTEYQALTDSYIKTAEVLSCSQPTLKGFMILYSINSRNSFEYTAKIRKRVLEIRGGAKRLPPPILLVATKADLVSDRAVSTEEGQALANAWNSGIEWISISSDSLKSTSATFSRLPPSRTSME